MTEQTETSEVTERETRVAALLRVTIVDATIPAAPFIEPKLPVYLGD
jgi:hypothetical protein